jgi:pSer/pThr/pTyr-binding forkhead associated (FHA) protein
MPKVSVTAIPSSESPSVPEGFAIPGGTIVNAAPQVPVTVNVSEGFAIPGGTIVNATPQVSSMPTTIPAQVEQEERKEVLTDEQVTPTNSLNGMDVSDIGSFAFGGFGSMDARQW